MPRQTPVISLQSLPTPQVLDNLTFRQIYESYVRAFIALEPEYESLLESDPIVKLIQAASYREYILRQAFNDAALSNLLAFSEDSDLDHLAAFYNVRRLDGETNEQLRTRIQLRIEGWSSAGGRAQYRFWALSASADVQDAGVFSPTPGKVDIYILTHEGIPSEELLAAVRAVVDRDDVKVFTDTVEVFPASAVSVNVTVNVRLRSTTPDSVYNTAVQEFPERLASNRALGWDLTRSWIQAQFQQEGVYDVEVVSPATDVVCPESQFVMLNSFTPNLLGRLN